MTQHSPLSSATTQRKKNRKAFTLVEILLVLAISTTLITITMTIYSMVHENTKINSTINDVAQIRSVIEALYPFQTSYVGISPDDLKTSLPTSSYNGADIINLYQGTIVIKQDTINEIGDSYDIILTNLDIIACRRVSMLKFGNSLYAVKIAASTTDPDPVAGANINVPLTTAVATASCSSTYNSVGFQFH